MRHALIAGLLLLASPLAAPAALAAPAPDDYPTAARAEYVFACMAVNGTTQDALRRCACSVDVIAEIVPFGQYEQAETVLRMRQTAGGGYLAQEFRVRQSNDMVRTLQEAQAEAEVRCF